MAYINIPRPRSGQHNVVCGRSKGLCNQSLECARGALGCKEGCTFVPVSKENHWDNGQCWCKPELDFIDNETGELVFVHKVMA